MSSFLKDFISVGLSKISVIIFSLASSIIVARSLGPEANGIISSLTVYPYIFMAIGALGVRQATTYYVGKNKYDLDEIKRAIVAIWLFASIFSLVVCYYLIKDFSSNGSDIQLVFLSLLPIPFSLFATYNSGIFLGQNNIGTFNKINWLPALITFLSNVILVLFLKMGIPGALISSWLGVFLMFIILLIKNRFIQYFTFNINFSVVKSLFSLGLVYAFALVLSNLNYRVDVIMLDHLSNNFQLGIYSKGANLMEYLWHIPMLLGTLVFARSATAKNGVEFSRKVVLLLRISLVTIALASTVLFIFSSFVVNLLYGSAFNESGEVLRLLSPGVVLLTFFKVLNMDLAGKGKPWASIVSMSAGLVINVVLNFIFIPLYGANGAALTSSISYCVSGVVFLFTYSKIVTIPIAEILMFSSADLSLFKRTVFKAK